MGRTKQTPRKPEIKKSIKNQIKKLNHRIRQSNYIIPSELNNIFELIDGKLKFNQDPTIEIIQQIENRLELFENLNMKDKSEKKK